MEDLNFIDALAIGNGLSENIADLNEIFNLSLPLVMMDSFQEETKNKILLMILIVSSRY